MSIFTVQFLQVIEAKFCYAPLFTQFYYTEIAVFLRNEYLYSVHRLEKLYSPAVGPIFYFKLF